MILPNNNLSIKKDNNKYKSCNNNPKKKQERERERELERKEGEPIIVVLVVAVAAALDLIGQADGFTQVEEMG